jgi:hypothetical protein
VVLTRPDGLLSDAASSILFEVQLPSASLTLQNSSSFSSHEADTGAVALLKLAVPSRTPIGLPGPTRAFKACDVGALVLSKQPGPVHVTVARG